MKQVIIIPDNTDLNRGDQALIWESVALVKDVYNDDCEISIMSSYTNCDDNPQTCQTAKLGYKFITSVLKHPGRNCKIDKKDSLKYSIRTMIFWGAQAIIDYLRSRLLLSKNKHIRNIGYKVISNDEQNTVNAFKRADAIFVKGGGFIHSYGTFTDPYFMYFLTYHIRLAEALNKKVVILPNSIGPLNNKIARNIAIKALNRCSLVTVREEISKEYLKSLNVFSESFPDLGFFLKSSSRDFTSYLSSLGIPINHKKVVITLRPYRFNGAKDASQLFSNYIDGVLNIVRYLHEIGYHITFVAHTMGPSSHEDDRIAIEEVLSRLNSKERANCTLISDYNLNCKDLEKIYSYYDYMIGTRFHSIIFSINERVPAIAIAYGGNKGKGIMGWLGVDKYSVDIDKIQNNSLTNMFLLLSQHREEYLESISKSYSTINSQRVILINKIRKILEV